MFVNSQIGPHLGGVGYFTFLHIDLASEYNRLPSPRARVALLVHYCIFSFFLSIFSVKTPDA